MTRDRNPRQRYTSVDVPNARVTSCGRCVSRTIDLARAATNVLEARASKSLNPQRVLFASSPLVGDFQKQQQTMIGA
jgi:hypothetical protein